MFTSEELLRRISGCVPGHQGWKDFEDGCIALLEHLFVPPLNQAKIQVRSLSGIDRRDAVFPNRNFGISNPWGHLLHELDARMILVEFKNYDLSNIGKDEVDQARNYLTAPMGRLGIICCNKPPVEAAYIRRNSAYSSEGKVILFLTPDHLGEMCLIKDRGDDPADLIIDLLDEFYLQYVGNGLGYREGVDEGALPYYEEYIENFSEAEVVEVLHLMGDTEFKTVLDRRKPDRRVRQLARMLKPKHSDIYVQRALDQIIEAPQNTLYGLYDTKNYKEVLKNIPKHL